MASAYAVISAQGAVFTQTIECFVLVKATKKKKHKRVPVLDTQSPMNNFGFNVKISALITLFY